MYGVDNALIQAMSGKRTLIIADSGMYTMMSMVYWAFREPGVPLIVTPKLRHQLITRELEKSSWKINDEVRACRIVTPQWLLSNHAVTPDRTVLEMDNMGVTQTNFIRQCVRDDRRIAVRCLHHKVLPLVNMLKPLGFTVLRYHLDFNVRNEPVAAIKVVG